MRRRGRTRKGRRTTMGVCRHHLDFGPSHGLRGFSGKFSAFRLFLPHSFHSLLHYSSHISPPSSISSCSSRCSPFPWEDIATSDHSATCGLTRKPPPRVQFVHPCTNQCAMTPPCSVHRRPGPWPWGDQLFPPPPSYSGGACQETTWVLPGYPGFLRFRWIPDTH